MDLVKLTEYLVKSIVKEPDMISVKQLEDEKQLILEILVQESDMGLVIGRHGNNANAIRTIVLAAAYIQNKRVKLNFDCY